MFCNIQVIPFNLVGANPADPFDGIGQEEFTGLEQVFQLNRGYVVIDLVLLKQIQDVSAHNPGNAAF